MLIGGEENFTRALRAQQQRVLRLQRRRRCSSGRSTKFEGPLAQVPPAGNGFYADGKPVAGALGCSVHWFQEHPSFRNGGLVAISEYEDGVRFLQIGKDGSITEQGYFLSLGSSSSSPKWAGKGDVLYSIDYLRGIDILRCTGEHYVPGQDASASRIARHQRRHRAAGARPRHRPPSAARSQRAARQRLGAAGSAAWWRATAERQLPDGVSIPAAPRSSHGRQIPTRRTP